MTANTGKEHNNFFLKLKPLHRLLLSLSVAVIVYLCVCRSHLGWLLISMLLWNVFSLSYLAASWVVLLTRSIPQIRAFARKEDGSNAFVFFLIILSSLASMVMVALLILSPESAEAKTMYLVTAISGILFSWGMVHTTFCFHYAHMYYDDDRNNHDKHAAGLEFPEDEHPDYLDFAYFSFVIGMTFQVSDVEISAKKIRRVALLHGLLSFLLNTFVVALTINLIAGLK